MGKKRASIKETNKGSNLQVITCYLQLIASMEKSLFLVHMECFV